MSSDAREKREVLNNLLLRGTTQLVLDPRAEDVQVPDPFRTQPLLRINVSPRFPNSDLEVSWWGVRQTLTFPSGRFHCKVPWDAIFAMGDPRKMERLAFWDDSIPPELRDVFARAGERHAEQAPHSPPSAPTEESPRGTRTTRAFTPRVIPGLAGRHDDAADPPEDAAEGDPPPEGDDPPPKPPRGRPPFLRVVK